MDPLTLSRRTFLRASAAALAGTALSACTRLAAPTAVPPTPTPTQAMPVALARLTCGPTAAERARVAEIGLAAWIEEQLAPEQIDDSAADWRLRRFESLRLSAAELADWRWEDVLRELRQATLIRQCYSRRQLYERLVAFWNNHFYVTTEKGENWFLKTVDEREVARAHAFGTFHDLLWASAHSPAMLVYLDNQVNVAGAPNENYARELLELHTLGVPDTAGDAINSGYTQADVQALARCLTGWSVKEHFWRGQFTFDEKTHDTGEKLVLGQRLAPAGQAEAETVLATLATHPSTAYHLAFKLAQHFIADDPPSAVVTRTAATFTQTQGDIRATLRTLLLDGLLPLADAQLPPKFKRPQHALLSALRALDAESDLSEPVQIYLARLGHTPFAWPTPDGVPDVARAWDAHLLPRWQFALALAYDELDGTRLDLPALLAGASDPDAILATLATRLLGAPLAPARQAALRAALADDAQTDASRRPAELEAFARAAIAALVAAPEFQWH